MVQKTDILYSFPYLRAMRDGSTMVFKTPYNCVVVLKLTLYVRLKSLIKCTFFGVAPEYLYIQGEFNVRIKYFTI